MSGRPLSVVETTQSVVEIYERHGVRVAKKVARTSAGADDVRAQIRMLSSLPPTFAPHYPQLLEASSEPPEYYIMPFVDLPSLRSLVFLSQTPVAPLVQAMKQVVAFLFGEQFLYRTAAAPSTHLEEAYVRRMRARLASLGSMNGELKRLSITTEVVMDGDVLLPPSAALDRILTENDLLVKMQPERLGWIHGQMAFFHILVDVTSEACGQFVLLDPRGADALGDAAHDVGKIWQSVHSMIDLVEEGLFDLAFHWEGERLIVDSFTLAASERHPVAAMLYHEVRQQIADLQDELGDPFCLLRSDFAEAVHLASAVPFNFHGSRPLQRAVACYLLSTRAFNDFLVNNAIPH